MDSETQLGLPLEFGTETTSEAVQRALALGLDTACLHGSTVSDPAVNNVQSAWGLYHHHLSIGGGSTVSPMPPPTAPTTEPVAEDGLTPTDFVVWLAGAADLEHGEVPTPAQWSRIVYRARNQVAGVARARFARRGGFT